GWFKNVLHLVIDRNLPDAGERVSFNAEVAPLRVLPDDVAEVLRVTAKGPTPPPMALRTALSHLAGVNQLPASLDCSVETLRHDALRLSAAVPTLIAALQRLRLGLAPVPPRDDLGHAANYLYMLDVEEPLAQLKPGRALHTNVEWFAAVVMELCGLPRELFTSTFAASRVVGWCAQSMEQARDNRIIRPSARYIGPPPPQPVPIG